MGKFVNNLKKKFKDKRGFTLIELIVVIAVIGILVLLAAPRFLGYTKDANVSAMKADAKVLSNAALLYNIEHPGVWPTVDMTAEDTEDIDGDVSTTTLGSAVAALMVDSGIPAEVSSANYALLDDVELAAYVKTIKNPIGSYVLVIDGDFEGEVFHIGGVEDRAGDTHFGVDLKN